MSDVGPLEEHDVTFARRVALTNVALFSLLVTGQWIVWSGFPAYRDGEVGLIVVGHAAGVLAVSLACGLVVVAAWVAARPLSSGRPFWYGVACIAAAFAAAVPQSLVLAHIDSTPIGLRSVLTLWLTAGVSYAVAIGAALLTAVLLIRYREADALRRAEEARAVEAAAAMEAEELRVRQMVADRLHGTIQNRLVVVGVGLESLADELAGAGDADRADRLRRWADDLDRLREEDVRSVSHALFPTGANIGTFEAIRLMLDRLPPSVATELDLGPGAQRIADGRRAPIPVPLRLTAVYTIEEALTNALKHGARSVRIAADIVSAGAPGGSTLEVVVDDDGRGLAGPEPELHGLERHRARIAARGGSLSLAPGPSGGARLRFTVPLAPA